jgi:hypothetical protein
MRTFKHFKDKTNEGIEIESIEIGSAPEIINPKTLPSDIVEVFEKRLADEYTAH